MFKEHFFPHSELEIGNKYLIGPRQANLVLIAYASSEGSGEPAHRAVSPKPPLFAQQAVSHEEPSDRKPDPWPLWMPGHAQLQFVMTECSKTQIRLTGLNCELVFFISDKMSFPFHFKQQITETEAEHDKTNKMTFVPRKDSYQLRHLHSLTWVFSVGLKIVWALSYQ